MFFFYFVLESALLATQRTSPQEYAVRFSRKSHEIFENIWISKSSLCDQIHVKQTLNQTIITNQTTFYRKHVKFFEKSQISTSPKNTKKSLTYSNSTHDSDLLTIEAPSLRDSLRVSKQQTHKHTN